MISSLLMLALAFPLEWNTTYRTDVPYEVELNVKKLGASAFTVLADGREIPSTSRPGKAPDTVDLRFTVPAGTRKLSCEGRKVEKRGGGGEGKFADASDDNLFDGVLGDPARWTCDDNVRLVKTEKGLLFRSVSGTWAKATATVDLPEGAGGKPVWQELDVTSRSRLVWGGATFVEQLDAGGKVLPETLCDRRWTTHMRPKDKLCRYRDEGHVHPKARKLRLVLVLDRREVAFDEYGLPIVDKTELDSQLELTHLAVRFAERLPFPKWNDDFFAPGASGKAGDFAFRLGGPNAQAMSFQARTRAAWTQSHQFRDESDILLPSGAGTVEVDLKPDWGKVPVTIFEGDQSYIACECKRGMRRMFALDYDPVKKEAFLLLRDWKGHLAEGKFPGVEIPNGVWSHVAVTWKPGVEAKLFVNGHAVARLPIPEFEAVPIADRNVCRNPNDSWAMEFFVGCTPYLREMRDLADAKASEKLVQGAMDNLRVSSGCRFAGDFTPAKATLDGDTRALFAFDRWFDGVSGGGFGFIPATVFATTDRVEHQVKVEKRGGGGQQIVQYYPKELLPENDPMKVLDHDNYPDLPSDAEYREARIAKTRSFTVKPGEKITVTAAERAYPDYVEYANESATERVAYPLLVRSDKLDTRSFGDLRDSICVDGTSDRDRVNRLFQFVMNASDYFMNHQADFKAGSDAPVSACYEAMTMLNSYCGFECGPLNNMTANMLATVAGCPACQTGGYGHEFEQVFYDGKNHIYDLSARKFFPSFDNETSVYLKEAGDQPHALARVGTSADHFYRRGTRGSWCLQPNYVEKFGLVLNPGERLRVWYANDMQMNNINMRAKSGVYGMKKLPPGGVDYAQVVGAKDDKNWSWRRDRVFPQYSTAVLAFDGRPARTNPAFAEVTDASFCYSVRMPYPIVWGEYEAELADGKRAALELSTDGGKTFAAVPRSEDGRARLEYRVRARHAYLVRVKAPIGKVVRFVARTEGEVNPRIYPGWMKGGENVFTYKAESGAVRITQAWREPAKEIVVSGCAYKGAIPGFEMALTLVDPARPSVLAVTGVSPQATVKTYGRLSAKLEGGRLTLAYDGSRKPLLAAGDDRPGTTAEFPCLTGFEIVDGEAKKATYAIVSPDARLVVRDDPKAGEWEFKLPFEPLPAGKYQVFALGRCASHRGFILKFVDPATPKDAKRTESVWRDINEFFDYRGMVFFGREGGRSRWKWDTVLERPSSASGWLIHKYDFPAGTDSLTFVWPWKPAEGFEFAAALVLPDPDDESQLMLRNLLFGINTDPIHVK